MVQNQKVIPHWVGSKTQVQPSSSALLSQLYPPVVCLEPTFARCSSRIVRFSDRTWRFTRFPVDRNMKDVCSVSTIEACDGLSHTTLPPYSLYPLTLPVWTSRVVLPTSVSPAWSRYISLRSILRNAQSTESYLSALKWLMAGAGTWGGSRQGCGQENSMGVPVKWVKQQLPGSERAYQVPKIARMFGSAWECADPLLYVSLRASPNMPWCTPQAKSVSWSIIHSHKQPSEFGSRYL